VTLSSVVRWQNSDGLGVYEGGHLINYGDYQPRQPGPWGDGTWDGDMPEVAYREQLFGFQSDDQSQRWFTPQGEEQLVKQGYRRVRVGVLPSLVYRGECQATFPKRAVMMEEDWT
jgi:hypothetical protein